MRNTLFISSIILLSSIFSSCDQKEKVVVEKTEGSQIEGATSNDSFYTQFPNAKKMQEIEDRLVQENRVESLYWQKQVGDDFQYVQVTAYLNEDGLPMKISEEFINGNQKPEGERHYYIDNSYLIACYEQVNYWKDSMNTEYKESRTIFEDKKPVITQERKANNYYEVQDKKWEAAETKDYSMKKVNNILSGAEEFELHFISIIKADQLFLLLGEDKPQTEDRYTTAVRVDEITPFIEDLIANKDEYKFKPLEISFEVVGGNNAPEYRILKNIKWKN